MAPLIEAKELEHIFQHKFLTTLHSKGKNYSGPHQHSAVMATFRV